MDKHGGICTSMDNCNDVHAHHPPNHNIKHVSNEPESKHITTKAKIPLAPNDDNGSSPTDGADYNNYNDRARQRYGISPVIATTIILGITVTLGIALWAFANSSVGTSATTYANTITDYINYLRERFVIFNMAFKYDAIENASAPSACSDNAKCVSIWLYNNGQVPLNVKTIILSNSNGVLTVNSIYGCILVTDDDGSSICRDGEVTNMSTDMFRIGAREVGVIAFQSEQALSNGAYTVRVLTERGNMQVYNQSLG
ncbi:MAG: hypothetical protein QW572_06475 [Candidatus Nitrosocaldus sp.]